MRTRFARTDVAGNSTTSFPALLSPRVVMAAATKTPLPRSRPANAPQRNGDPVNRQVASHPDRYASN